MMLEKGYAFSGSQTAFGGTTPLLWYSKSLYWVTEGVAILVRHGAGIRARDLEGNTCPYFCLEFLDTANSRCYHISHPAGG